MKRAAVPALALLHVAACGEPARSVEPVAIPSASPAATAEPAASVSPATSASAPAPARTSDHFDRGAAAAALSAVEIGHCRTAAEPNLSGSVTIAFAPTGVATSAKVDGPHAATPIGGCIAAAYRAARVPPFDGQPMVVHKSFQTR